MPTSEEIEKAYIFFSEDQGLYWYCSDAGGIEPWRNEFIKHLNVLLAAAQLQYQRQKQQECPMPTSDPLYRLVDLWREGKLKQVMLMDQRDARTMAGEPLAWPWSIMVEGQTNDLTYMALNGKTPRHAARRSLRWATDPKYRKAVIEKHRRELERHPRPTRRTIRLEVPHAE